MKTGVPRCKETLSVTSYNPVRQTTFELTIFVHGGGGSLKCRMLNVIITLRLKKNTGADPHSFPNQHPTTKNKHHPPPHRRGEQTSWDVVQDKFIIQRNYVVLISYSDHCNF